MDEMPPQETSSARRTKAGIPSVVVTTPLILAVESMDDNTPSRRSHKYHRFRYPKRRTEPPPRLLDTSLSIDRKSLLHYIWYACIAVSALLDFLAKVVADAVSDYFPNDEALHLLPAHKLNLIRRARNAHRARRLLHTDEPLIVDFIQFLDKYSIPIGLCFSVLWLTDAFVKAKRKRDERLQELDRHYLLQHHDASSDNSSKAENDEEDFKFGAWGAYYRTVLVQCLLLPISSILIIHHVFSPAYTAREILMDEDEQIRFTFRNDDGKIDEVHSFRTSLSKSILFVLAQYFGTVFVRITKTHVRAAIKGWLVRTGKTLTVFAVRHPRRFARRLNSFRRILRWAKYLAPLIGACNKLKGNTADLFKKWRQRAEAMRTERARKLLWQQRRRKKNRTPEEQLQMDCDAAIMVQANFRRMQARKRLKALKLLIGNKREFAAQRLQSVMRRKLAQVRARLLLKKKELQDLERKQLMLRHHNKDGKKPQMDVKERRRLYKLQRELGVEAHELLNQKLLLRPNTRFAVTWKVVFVVCVLFEISQIALAPKLEEYIDDNTGEQLNIEKVLDLHLVPLPTSEWPQCGAVTEVEEKKKVARKQNRLLWLLRRAKRRTLERLAEEEEKRRLAARIPWYCSGAFPVMHKFYIYLLKFFIHELLVVVGIVCFMDVFVTFFTGELHNETGNVIPKPFFTRWILPGIILQLLVNPQMETISYWTGWLLGHIKSFGPIRVYRWTAAFFYPLFAVLTHLFIDRFWRPLVRRNNDNPLADDPFDTPKSTRNLTKATSRRGFPPASKRSIGF